MTSSPESATRVVAYLRRSTAEQASDGMSLDAQEARIRPGLTLWTPTWLRWSPIAGVSDSKALGDRQGGRRIAALLDARKPTAAAVAVLRLERLGRDPAETLTLLRRFRTSRVALVSIADRLDVATPQGRAMAGVTAVFAGLERALIAQRTADALGELRSQGRAWNHAPYGWAVRDARLAAERSDQATLAGHAKLRPERVSFARTAAPSPARAGAPSGVERGRA